MHHCRVHLLAVAATVLTIQSAAVSPGDPVTIRVTGALPAKPVRVYLSSSAGILTRVGTIARGGRMLRISLPGLAADVYAPAARTGFGTIVRGRGRLSVRALPPPDFGPVGSAGCSPASPRVGPDVFGTAAGAQLWALGAAGPDAADTASLDGVIGKEKKIVFRMTSGVPTVFYSVAPDGRRVPPIWGPSPHLGSTWTRPGYEWGAGFVFDVPGCWRIHAGAPPAQGDVWVVVGS